MQKYRWFFGWAILAISITSLYSGCSKKSDSFDESDRIVFTDQHLDFSKNRNGKECCTSQGKQFAISSGGTHSSKCGKEVREQGGNVVDVVVATAFCLAVERPQSAGLGGGGFLVMHDARTKQVVFVDFRETAPGRATRDMYLDAQGKKIRSTEDGGLSVAIPGFVAGMVDTHERYGKLPFTQVLRPAIRLARTGFPVYPSMVARIKIRQPMLKNDEQLRGLFLPGGEPIAAGQLLVQENLARTIELVGQTKKDEFYHGLLARTMAQAIRRTGGIADEQDFAAYQTRFSTPLRGEYEGNTIFTTRPQSAGGVILLQSMNTVAGYSFTPQTPASRYLHVLTESFRRAFANRSRYIGDPAFFLDETYLSLISPAYAQLARNSIDLNRATPSTSIRPAEAGKTGSMDTTHLSVMDSDGNAAAMTMTVNNYFGAGVAAPGTGIVLNDTMDDFNTEPGKPDAAGLLSGASNEIRGGKRPVSNMTPTLVFRDGRPILAIGAPGGSHISTGVTNVMLNYFTFFPMDLKKSIFAPRIHHQWMPDKLIMEMKGFSDATKNRLTEMGHKIENPKFTALMYAVGFDGRTGTLTSVHDPRDEGGTEAN